MLDIAKLILRQIAIFGKLPNILILQQHVISHNIIFQFSRPI